MSRPRRKLRHELDWQQFKSCTVCEKSKPFAEFPLVRRNPDGSASIVRSMCYSCHSARVGPRTLERRRRQREGTWAGPSTQKGPMVSAVALRKWLHAAKAEVWALEDLAGLAGVDVRTLRRVKAGEQFTVGVDVLDRLALATGLDLDDFAGTRTCNRCGDQHGWPWDGHFELPVFLPVLGRVNFAAFDFCFSCMNEADYSMLEAA